MLDAAGSKALIEVDGGVIEANAGQCMENGADVLVAGTAFFKAPDRKAFVQKLLEMDKR